MRLSCLRNTLEIMHHMPMMKGSLETLGEDNKRLQAETCTAAGMQELESHHHL